MRSVLMALPLMLLILTSGVRSFCQYNFSSWTTSVPTQEADYDDPRLPRAALSAGASDYVIKDELMRLRELLATPT